MNMITYDEKARSFHLSNGLISYIFAVNDGILEHRYFGRKVARYTGGYSYPAADRSFSPNPPESGSRLFSYDTMMLEYPANTGDYRSQALEIEYPDGSNVSDFRYLGYDILKEKPVLPGLPFFYDEGDSETLILHLKDAKEDLYLDLTYTIYQNRRAITRSNRLQNGSQKMVHITKMASAVVDFNNRELDLIHLSGSWSREREIVREKITAGVKAFGSSRGSSSHHHNPFAALAEPAATEKQGEVFGASLVYSGNHEFLIEKDPYRQTRLLLGINPQNFRWELAAGDEFTTPEAVLVFSENGLNEMSHTFHRLIQERLVRSRYKDQPRPILTNNWEATFFDFDEDKILRIAKEAKEIGAELFVLDDGWFGHRDDDTTSLGDWVEDRRKLPHGLKGLSDKIHEMGLTFGLWFEPEMVSKESRLFEEHPDWVLQIPGRPMSPGRGQFVLDFSRKEVRDTIYTTMAQVLRDVRVDYVKWDMNRNMTEVFSASCRSSQQGEVSHRYILGLYDFLDKLNREFPEILFESCSGGGGRFDLGMLAYMPQVWTSDNTDAVSRMKIQYGTSLVYPPATMGAHVASVPNHQTGRMTSLKTRGNVAMSGIFGYELDLTALTVKEKAEMKEQVAFYKEHRQLIQYGTFYRLKDPFAGNEAAWVFVAPDKSEALVFYSRILAEASAPFHTLTLTGLDPSLFYEGAELSGYGDELMTIGFYAQSDSRGDFQSNLYYLKAVAK